MRVVIVSSQNIFKGVSLFRNAKKTTTVFFAGDAATEEVDHVTCLMLVNLSEPLPSATSSSMAPLTWEKHHCMSPPGPAKMKERAK